MQDTEAAQDTGNCFKLKGSRVTMTILELYRYDYQSFNDALSQTVSSAPDFFQQTPVILSLERCPEDTFVDFIELGELCREYGMVPVAVRGGTEEQLMSANVAGLPKLPPAAAGSNNSTKISDSMLAGTAPQPAKEVEIVNEVVAPPEATTKLVTTPVRSGQQIYSEGDLIVLAAVGAGAEILADGNIHVYGPLRGRALAGVNGDRSAMVFCHSLEAELISIAGNYKVNEDLQGDLWKQPVKVSLDGDQLKISSI